MQCAETPNSSGRKSGLYIIVTILQVSRERDTRKSYVIRLYPGKWHTAYPEGFNQLIDKRHAEISVGAMSQGGAGRSALG